MVRKLTLLAAVLAYTTAAPLAADAAVTAPAASTGGAYRITASTAHLTGTVNPHGQSTTYSFQYGTSQKYGATTPAAPAGAGNTAVTASADIGGLVAVTTYHYRLVASSPAGVVAGADRTFKTLKIPLSLSLAATPNPVPFGAATALIGILAGTGGGGRSLQVQQNAFPYTAGFANAPISPVVTAANGAFSVPFSGLLVNTQVRVMTSTGKSLVSPPVLVGVAPKVRTAVSTRHPRRGRFVRFSGTVTPSWVPAQVAIQRRGAHGAWVTVAGNVTHADGPSRARYAKSTRVRRAGTYRVFVGLANSQYTAATGPSVRITPRSR